MRSVVGCEPESQAGSGLPQIKCTTTPWITKKSLLSELSVKTLGNAAFLAHTAALFPGLVGGLGGGSVSTETTFKSVYNGVEKTGPGLGRPFQSWFCHLGAMQPEEVTSQLKMQTSHHSLLVLG